MIPAWIDDGEGDVRLVSTYVDEAKESEDMRIQLYDKIKLKDGTTASVVEILEPDKEYIVDVDLPAGGWETREISINQIDTTV